MLSMCRFTIISIAAQTWYTYILVITLPRKLFNSLPLSAGQLIVTTKVLAVKCTSMPLVSFDTAALDNLYICCRSSAYTITCLLLVPAAFTLLPAVSIHIVVHISPAVDVFANTVYD